MAIEVNRSAPVAVLIQDRPYVGLETFPNFEMLNAELYKSGVDVVIPGYSFDYPSRVRLQEIINTNSQSTDLIALVTGLGADTDAAIETAKRNEAVTGLVIFDAEADSVANKHRETLITFAQRGVKILLVEPRRTLPDHAQASRESLKGAGVTIFDEILATAGRIPDDLPRLINDKRIIKHVLKVVRRKVMPPRT